MGMFWRRFNFDARAGLGVTPIRKVVALGDSLVNQTTSALSSTTNITSIRGDLVQIQSLTGGRFIYDARLNLGISGETSAQIAARLPSALATDADTLWTEGGTNDGVSVTVDQLWDILLNQTYLPWLAQRPNLIIRTITQRTQARWGTETADTIFQKDRAEAIRLRQLAFAAQMGGRVIVVDPVAAMNDPGGGYKVARDDLFVDGLHYSAKGADLIGKVGAAVVGPRVQAADFNMNADPGTLLTNPVMAGTGGSITASVAMTGVTPNGWLGTRIRGSTLDSGGVVWSKEARSDGQAGEWAVATATNLVRAASDGNERYGLTQTIDVSSGKYAAGDVIEVLGELQAVSSNGTLLGFWVELLEYNGTDATQAAGLAGADVNNPMTVWDTPRIVRAPRRTVRTIGSSGTRQLLIRANIMFDPRVSSSWQVKVGRFVARKVA